MVAPGYYWVGTPGGSGDEHPGSQHGFSAALTNPLPWSGAENGRSAAFSLGPGCG